MSEGASQSSALDDFLNELSSGEKVDEGRFTVASDKMLDKLRLAVVEPDVWMIKLLQAAVTANAGFVITRVGKLQLKSQIIAKKHPPLSTADFFLNDATRSSTHHNLMLCFVWLMNDRHSRVQLRWSTEDSVEQLVYNGTECHSSSMQITQDRHRFIELIVERRPATLMEMLFRKASFAGEIQHLETRSYLAPLTSVLDNRELHRGPFLPDSHSRGLYHARGSSGLRKFYCSSRLSSLVKADDGRHRLRRQDGRRVVEATAYVEVSDKPGKSTLYWVVDGIVISSEPAHRSFTINSASIHLFLSANGMGTDISTLALTENDELQSHRLDESLSGWCFAKVY